MHSKQTVYILLAAIMLLSVLFLYATYTNYKKTNQLNSVINQFNNKLKNDSLYFINSNKDLINKITQHIVDSLTTITNDNKLILAKNKLKEKSLIVKNNNSILKKKKLKSNIELDLDDSKITSSNNKTTEKSVVTTYSQIEGYQIEQSENNSNTYNNVTTYSQLKNNKTQNINSKATNPSLNSTYTPISNKNPITKHNNPLLDNALNINNVDNVPVYNGCEQYMTEINKKKCFETKIYNQMISNINSNNNKKSINRIEKIRVLFIINKNGFSETAKIVGNWSKTIQTNIKQAIKSIPKMKPGYKNNKSINIKYSILIPYNI